MNLTCSVGRREKTDVRASFNRVVRAGGEVELCDRLLGILYILIELLIHQLALQHSTNNVIVCDAIDTRKQEGRACKPSNF